MNTIPIKCPACGTLLHIPEKFAGQTGRCNYCLGTIVVPAPAQIDPPSNVGPAPSPVIPPQSKSNRSPATIACAGCLILGAIPVIILFAAVAIAPSPASDAPTAEGTTPTQQWPSTNEAYVITQDFVRDRLIAPRTAKFAFFPDNVSTDGQGGYTILGSVDAQNRAGALIRHQYVCSVQFNGGQWSDRRNWTVLMLEVDSR